MADFLPHDYARRVRAVGGVLAGAAAQWLLVTAPADIRYLCGFTGSAGVLLVSAEEVVLITDGRYTEAAAEQAPTARVVIDRNTVGAVAAVVGSAACAIDPHEVTVAVHARLVAAGASAVSVDGAVRAVRAVKEPGERQRIEAACAISDEALAAVLPRLQPGVTERLVARWLADEMLNRGADDLAFATIVAAGPHGAQPHHVPCERPIESGELVTIDFGALVEGYHSDQTRTVCVGAPAQWQCDLHGLVERAQAAAREVCRAGVALAELDAAARGPIAAAGHGEHYPHGLGHGVGLQIHEAPMVGASATGTLAADVPVTVEPGVYLPGRGGVRIEDTMWAGVEGTVPLTRSPRELLVLG